MRKVACSKSDMAEAIREELIRQGSPNAVVTAKNWDYGWYFVLTDDNGMHYESPQFRDDMLHHAGLICVGIVTEARRPRIVL